MNQTSWGLEFKCCSDISEHWNSYDKSVANAHLMNYGFIIVGLDGCPIDNEYDLCGIEDEFASLFTLNK